MHIPSLPVRLLGCLLALSLLVSPAAPAQGQPPPPEPVPPISAEPYQPPSAAPSGQPAAAPGDHSLPDLDALYIERTPAYNYDAAKNDPAPGEVVTFTGHIANRGLQASGGFAYRWVIDGVDQPKQAHASLAAAQAATVAYTWAWQNGPHTVSLVLDVDGAVAEFSETNNLLADRTNAISFGVYVDQGFYDFFNQNVWQSGWGGNSFDDWIQRHVAEFNTQFAAAVHPLTPLGVTERIRLGKVVVVPNGGTHCNPNFPADDKQIDLIWGFLSEGVGVSGGCAGWLPSYRDNHDLWNLDRGIIHEVTHARYLIDLYGFNVDAHPNHLSAAVTASATTLPLQEVPDIEEYRVPFTLVIEGEIVVCNGKNTTAATNCQRGQANTTARAHAANAVVLADKFLITDGLGNALAGDPAMPYSGWMFYYEPYFAEDLMDSGSGFGEHSAYAWQRIAGQRARCGNANAPCNIGEYLSDIPARNDLQLTWGDGQPVTAGVVEIYRPRPFPVWYGQSFIGTPDLTLYTDSSGSVSLGAQPFGPEIIHTWGHVNGMLIVKVTDNDRIGTAFFPLTEANIAYWQGRTTSARYPLVIENYRDFPGQNLSASISGGPYAGAGPLQTSFQATGLSGSITRYQWEFGDGQTATGPNVTHRYTRPGVFTVSLAVYGPSGGYRAVREGLVTVTGGQVYYLPITER